MLDCIEMCLSEVDHGVVDVDNLRKMLIERFSDVLCKDKDLPVAESSENNVVESQDATDAAESRWKQTEESRKLDKKI